MTIVLLADRPWLIGEVGRIRWREWGRPPEPEGPHWWIATTRRESGRAGVPVTFAAVDAADVAVGAVGLGEYDLDERRDRSPWLMGMVVRPEWRGRGVGRALVSTVESHAAAAGYAELWVATTRAAGFYARCGWRPTERFRSASGEVYDVLTKGA